MDRGPKAGSGMDPDSREVIQLRKVIPAFLLGALLIGGLAWAKGPLNLAIIWHQHQPLYWNRLTGEYELPWVRVHGVQEYIDSPNILAEFPDGAELKDSFLDTRRGDITVVIPSNIAMTVTAENFSAGRNGRRLKAAGHRRALRGGLSRRPLSRRRDR